MLILHDSAANRANPLDTRRVPPDTSGAEAPPANYMNLPRLENTPEPQAPLPADSNSLKQTVAMLAAFKRQNDELAEQVQKLNEMADKIKGDASTLRTVLLVEKNRRERAEVYILNHRTEHPSLSLHDVFLPNRDVMVIQDEETGELVEEVDAMVQDTPRFAIMMEAQKNRETFQRLSVLMSHCPLLRSDCFFPSFAANVRHGDGDDDDDDDMEDDGAAETNDEEESFVADLLDPASGKEEHPPTDPKSHNMETGPATQPPEVTAPNSNPFANPPPPPARGLKRTASFRDDSWDIIGDPFNMKRQRLNAQIPQGSDAVKRIPVHHETPKRNGHAPSMFKTRPIPKPPLPKGTAMHFNMVNGQLNAPARPSTLGLAPPGPKPKVAPDENASPATAEPAPTSSPFGAPVRAFRDLVGRIYPGTSVVTASPPSQPQDQAIGDTGAAGATVPQTSPLERPDAFCAGRTGGSSVTTPLQLEDNVSGQSGVRSAMGPPPTLQRQSTVFGGASGSRSDTDVNYTISPFDRFYGTNGDATSRSRSRTSAANPRSLQREDSTISNISDRTVTGSTRPPMQREDSMISNLSDRTVTGTTLPSNLRQASVASSSGAWSSAATTGSSSLQREDSDASSSTWSTTATVGDKASLTYQRQASVASSSAWSRTATMGDGTSNFQGPDNVYRSIPVRDDSFIIANSTLLRQDSPAASDTSTRTVRQGYAPSRPSPEPAAEAPSPFRRREGTVRIPLAYGHDPESHSETGELAIGTPCGPPLRRHDTFWQEDPSNNTILDMDTLQPRRSGRQYSQRLRIGN